MRQDPLTHAQITDKQPSNQQWFCNTVFDNTNSFIAAFQLPSCSSSNHLSSYSGVWAKYFCFIMFFGKVNIKPDYETDKILSVHQRMLLVLCFLSCGGWIVGDNEIQAQKFRHLPELVMVNRSRRLCCWKKGENKRSQMSWNNQSQFSFINPAEMLKFAKLVCWV